MASPRGRAYLTGSMYNLNRSVTVTDVRNFLRNSKCLPYDDETPIIQRLVSNGETQSTTFTFSGPSKQACSNAILKLDGRTMIDESGETSEVGVDETFDGVTTLTESLGDVVFDFYFVHGLKGHGFKSWSTKPASHLNVSMWPRDVLPNFLSKKGYCGAYHTFGYYASWSGKKEMSQTIEAEAEELLSAVAKSRKNNPKTRNRRIFFVCHSLGGLVTCQALAALLDDSGPIKIDMEVKEQFFHSVDNSCLVDGLICFGTPFGGSVWANIFAPVARMWSGKTTFVSSLTVNNKVVKRAMAQFERFRHEAPSGIRLLIFYEKRSVKKLFLRIKIVPRAAAISSFMDVRKRSLLSDHSNIVKISGEHDRDFHKKIGPEILELVKGSLARKAQKDDQKLQNTDLVTVEIRTPEDIVKLLSDWLPPAVRDGIARTLKAQQMQIRIADSLTSTLLTFLVSPEMQQGIQFIMKGIDDKDNSPLLDKQLRNVDDPIEGTCDWLIKDEMFKTWLDSSSNEILFVEGEEGVGKSVLSKYLIQKLKRTAEHQKEPYESHGEVIFFFCQSVQTSPVSIMKHLILQLESKHPGLVFNALRKNPPSKFGQKLKIDQLWDVFKTMTEELTSDLYCVIDGLDQCIGYVQSKSEVDQSSNILRFLDELCKIGKGSPGKLEADNQMGSSRRPRMAILLTSRPIPQIKAATTGHPIRLVMQSKDIQARAEKMIISEIRKLVDEQSLPSELEDIIRNDLLEKSKQTGSAFQWAATSFKRLRDRPLTAAGITDTLASFRPGIYALYSSIIEAIPPEGRLKQLCAHLVHIILFAKEDLTIFDIQLCLTIADSNPYDEGARTVAVDSDELSEVISALQSLLTATEDYTICFRHQSVRDFFLQLHEEAGVFACPSDPEGHTKLSLLCIRYLLLAEQKVHTRQLSAARSDKTPTPHSMINDSTGRLQHLQNIVDESPFILYASAHWAFHTSRSGPISPKLLPMFSNFLRPDTLSYFLAQCFRDNQLGIDVERHDWSPTKPAAALSSFNLINLLRHTAVKKPKRKRNGFLRFSRQSPDEAQIFAFEIDIDERFQNGDTLLHLAAANGAVDVVRYLISLGSSGKILNNSGATPFSLAVAKNEVKAAQELINCGEAHERIFDEETATSLHMATFHGMKSIVKHLLTPDVHVDIRVQDGWTPLHVAAQSGNCEIALMLIQRGADVEAVKSSNVTPIYLAAQGGFKEFIEELVHIKPELDVLIRTEDGLTPLWIAAHNGHFSAFRYLSSRGGHDIPNTDDGELPIHAAALKGHSKIVSLAAEYSSVAAENRWGRAPIHLAAMGGHLETVKELIRLGADPNAKATDLDDSQGRLRITPLSIAVHNNHQALIEYLFDLKTTGKYRHIEIESVKCSRGQNLLHLAATAGNQNLVKKLIQDHNCDPLDKDETGWTPIHAATAAGYIGVVQYLIDMTKEEDFRIDECIGGVDSRNPFMTAVGYGRKDIAEYFIEACGANAAQVDFYGFTAVRLAIQSKSIETVELVLNHEASANVADIYGITPLHFAARGSLEQINLLLDHHASVDATNIKGWTAMHEAAYTRSEDCFLRLYEAGGDPCKPDNSGITPIDLADGYAPILENARVQSFLSGYHRIEEKKRLKLLEVNLRKQLDRPNFLRTGDDRPWDELEYAHQLSLPLLSLGRDVDATIVLEFILDRRIDNKPISRFQCLACENLGLTVGPWYFCRTCVHSRQICSECNEKRKKEGGKRMCPKSHKFMEIGGKTWESLERDRVDSSGRKIEEWLASLREEFGIVVVDEATTD